MPLPIIPEYLIPDERFLRVVTVFSCPPRINIITKTNEKDALTPLGNTEVRGVQ